MMALKKITISILILASVLSIIFGVMAIVMKDSTLIPVSLFLGIFTLLIVVYLNRAN